MNRYISDMPDYSPDKQCCGHGCDASFCEDSGIKRLAKLSNDTTEALKKYKNVLDFMKNIGL